MSHTYICIMSALCKETLNIISMLILLSNTKNFVCFICPNLCDILSFLLPPDLQEYYYFIQLACMFFTHMFTSLFSHHFFLQLRHPSRIIFFLPELHTSFARSSNKGLLIVKSVLFSCNFFFLFLHLQKIVLLGIEILFPLPLLSRLQY